jgi:uncharacterized membrane protein YraQ (UPF0718 family)
MNIIKNFKAPIIIAIIYLLLAVWLTDTAERSLLVAIDYAKEMVFIMPPVFILMGLLEIWIPKDKIQKWLGTSSGIRGIILSFLMGTLPTGPLYVAFPMTASLLKKGASISNMVVFLGSWAALKIPQLLVEIKFLGGAFTSLRFGLTLTIIIIIGIIMEILLKKDH